MKADTVCPAEQKELWWQSYVTVIQALIRCTAGLVQTCVNTEQNNLTALLAVIQLSLYEVMLPHAEACRIYQSEVAVSEQM